MAVTNLYSNLPGHLVEFKDGGLQLTSSSTDTSSTKSILILGTATDGPINEPVKIDAVTVSQVFGKEVDENGYPNGATLTKYAKQAFRNGFDDVRCMRVTGEQAYTTISGKQRTGTVTKSGLIADDEAIITGNKEVSKDFIQTANSFVGTLAENYQIAAIKADNTEFSINVGDSDNGVIRWHAYRGLTINADKLPSSFKSVKVTGTLYTFVGDGEGFIKTNAENVSVSAIEESDNVSLTVTLVEGAKLFASVGADQICNLMPALTSDYINGFKISLEDESVLTASDIVSVTKAENAEEYTIVLAVDGLMANDTVKVEYYAYEESTLEESIPLQYDDSVISVAELNDKENAQITSVTIGEEVTLASADDFTRRFTVANGTLTVNDIGNASIGDAIKVAYTYDEAVNYSLELKVKSQWGGSIYKDGSVEVRKVTEDDKEYTEVVFTKPSSKISTRATSSYYYSSKYYRTIDDLILAMKNDNNNLNMFEIEIVKGSGDDLVDLLNATVSTKLSNGGTDGLRPTTDEMFIALSGARYTESDIGTPVSEYSSEVVTPDMIGFLKTQGAYQILENYNVDFIYPAGVYADSVQTVNPNSDFQRELALVCAVLTYRTKMTHGFIDVKPNSNTTLVGIDAYVSKLVNTHENIYYMTDQNGDIIYDQDEKPMDIGWYTSVVPGPEPVMNSDVLGTYYGSPAIAYAALNAVLEPQSSPLNKALRNVQGMKFKFSNKQMDALIGKRMVCFKLKNEGLATASSTPYVVDGVTAGAPGCDFADITTVKILTDVVDQIRKVADPFIGEPNTLEQRNALSALISKKLAKLKELGEIQDYEFEVAATIQMQLLGEASIALKIVPAMTLKKITTVVALRAAQ